MKVQPQKTNKGITVVLEEGKILAVTAHETKFRLAAEFQKVLPSFTEFMQRIAHGLTVEGGHFIIVLCLSVCLSVCHSCLSVCLVMSLGS